MPPTEPPVLSRRPFDKSAEAYLNSDPGGSNREPPAVSPSGGWFRGTYDAWTGRFSYDLRLIKGPVAIIGGEWDILCADADEAWLRDGIDQANDLKIPRATHLMHLEENRYALYRAAAAFLTAKKD